MLFITWFRDAAYWRPGGPALLSTLCFRWRWILLITSRLPDLFPDLFISLHWGPKCTLVLCRTVSRIERVLKTLYSKNPPLPSSGLKNPVTLSPVTHEAYSVSLSEFRVFHVQIPAHNHLFRTPHRDLAYAAATLIWCNSFRYVDFFVCLFVLGFFFHIPLVEIWLHPFSTFLLAITLYDFAICSVLPLCWRLAGLFLLQTGNLCLSRASNKLHKQHCAAQQNYFFFW